MENDRKSCEGDKGCDSSFEGGRGCGKSCKRERGFFLGVSLEKVAELLW